MWTFWNNILFNKRHNFPTIWQDVWGRSTTVVQLTPDQKVACSNHVVLILNFLFFFLFSQPFLRIYFGLGMSKGKKEAEDTWLEDENTRCRGIFPIFCVSCNPNGVIACGKCLNSDPQITKTLITSPQEVGVGRHEQAFQIRSYFWSRSHHLVIHLLFSFSNSFASS